MVNVFDAASYVYNRYNDTYGTKIDEMKLHKLLYFAQRESLIQTNEPLFDAVFRGWKYGPILKEIREVYKKETFPIITSEEMLHELQKVMDPVFEKYAGKESWSLSRLTHGETSWKKSRIGIPEDENGDNPISLEDMKIDADRVRSKRELLNSLGIS